MPTVGVDATPPGQDYCADLQILLLYVFCIVNPLERAISRLQNWRIFLGGVRVIAIWILKIWGPSPLLDFIVNWCLKMKVQLQEHPLPAAKKILAMP